jgi:hypothetical protein
MAGQLPPKDITPTDLWTLITQTPRANKLIESPLQLPDGSYAPMLIWVLTQEESQLCTIEAEKFTRKMLKEKGDGVPRNDEVSEGYRNLYETRAAVEILNKACRKATDITKPFFPTAQEISKKLTTDQIGCLMREYIIVQQELGPIVSQMEQYEFNAWVEKLAKGGSAHFLGFLTSEAQNQFIVAMASQLYKLQMDKCSLILPPEENITNQNQI